MATRRSIPSPKLSPKADPHAAEIRSAAASSPTRTPAPAITHQGPGTGRASEADLDASKAILREGHESTSTATGSKTKEVESGAQAITRRSAEDGLKVPGEKDGSSATGNPYLPGSQSADGGVATNGPTASGQTGDEAGVTGRDASGTSTATDRLDDAVAGALDQLHDSRPTIRGGLDVFDSVGAGTDAGRPTGSTAASRDLGNPGGPSAGHDGGAEHAAGAVEQITSGGSSLFGDRLGGASADLALAAGLLDDASSRESSPGISVGDGPVVRRALELAEKAADGDDDAYRKLETLAAEMHKDSESASVPAAGIGYGVGTNSEGEVVAPAGPKTAAEQDPFWTAVAGMFMGTRDLAGNETVKGEALRESNDGVEDPGDPSDPDAPPTPAQIAFRASLREALGVYQGGSGDIDPDQTEAAPSGAGPFAGAANNSAALVGQPSGPGETGHTGTLHSGTGGADVDPLEGSAFTGPALGGNPEDLEFGSSILPLETARRAASSEDDEDQEDDSDEA